MGNYFDTAKNEGYVDGQLFRDHNEWRKVMEAKGYQSPAGSSSGGDSTSTAKVYPPFNFDWTKARQDALIALTPYYEQKLKDAKGDVELAKNLIEEDYKTGKRRREEDVKRVETYGAEDKKDQLETDTMTATEETRNTNADLNRRGVLFGEMDKDQQSPQAPISEYAKSYVLEPQNRRQQLRRMAIERVFKRQSEIAGIERTRGDEDATTTRQRGIAEQDREFPRFQAALEEEKRDKAANVSAPIAYQQALTQYRAANNIPS
jgi:hypothetical protein